MKGAGWLGMLASRGESASVGLGEVHGCVIARACGEPMIYLIFCCARECIFVCVEKKKRRQFGVKIVTQLVLIKVHTHKGTSGCVS